MADRKLDEYESLNFYAENTKPKKSGFSKFQVEDRFYFCRYADDEIVLLSQAYTGKPGRDNGIESVRKNEKIASRYKFDTRGNSGQGFGLRAGNGQEIAISPNYASLTKAQSVASRMSGASFTGTGTAAPKKRTTSKTAATTNPIAKKALAKKTSPRKVPARKVAAKKTPVKATRVAAKDSRIENYKPLSFYEQNGSMSEGFNSFEKNGAYYFHFVENGKVVLISESYTSKRGRDNGISSVMKNMSRSSAYEYYQHKNGKHYFDLNATNGQEVATSRWYSSNGNARDVTAYLRGEKTRTRKTNAKKPVATATRTKATSVKRAPSSSQEDNYQPIAFYQKHTKGQTQGFEKFKGDDGEHYFAYFDNGKLALISEGYPSAAIRDKGAASVKKNMKIENRYVQGTGAGGKPGFILRGGNHKEIARSVGYGSAAAALTGAAYLMGTRRRAAAKPSGSAKTVSKPVVKKVKKVAAASSKPKLSKPKVTAKPRVKPAAAGLAAAAGMGAAGLASAKTTGGKSVKPTAKPKPKAKLNVKPLAAGTVAVAGLGAGLAVAKTTKVKKASVPVKAAPIKASPIKAAAVVAAAAPISVPTAAPVVAAAATAAPIAAAAAATAAPVVGAGIWGWLKWILLALLGLLAALFLFKACATGPKDAKVATPVTTSSPAPAAMVSCWNGDKAKTEAACPSKISCWDDSFATSLSGCPKRPIQRNFNCWDGSKAVDLAGCPAKPAPKVAAVPEPKMSAPSISGRFCGPSPNPLFNVNGVTPINVTRLGTNVQFGNSLSLSPNAFYARLQTKYQTNSQDRAFLNYLAKSLGYRSFNEMDASMFSNDTLPNGTSGVLGFSQQHAMQFSTLNVTDPTDLEAFKVRSANGTDVHFMKRCGNFMYVCQP